MAFADIWTDSTLVDLVEKHVEQASAPFDRWLTAELRLELRARVRDALFTNATAEALVHQVAYPPPPAVPRAARLDDGVKKERKKPANDTEPSDEEKQRKLDARLQKLVLSGKKRVEEIARYLVSKRGGDFDELVQVGMVCVVEIAPDYEPSMASFPTYISQRVRNAMLYSLKVVSVWRRRISHSIEDNLTPRGGDDEELGLIAGDIALSEVLGLVDHAWPADQRLLHAELFARLAAARSCLDDEEREFIEQFYDQGKELRAIVDPSRKGWSERTLKRVHHDALRKLKAHLDSQAA